MTLAVAQEVLRAWDGDAPVELIAERENVVFRAALADGRAVALRLHRPGYRSRDAVAAELACCAALSCAGIACPAPVETSSGALLTEAPDGRLASVVAWIEGTPPQPDPERFHALGTLLARLHAAADRLDLPTHALPRWDIEGLLGDAPIWGRFWECPDISAIDRARLADLRQKLRVLVSALGDAGIGFIHADVLSENVLVSGNQVSLIDFDDCGVGFRGYDLGTALVSHLGRPDYSALEAAMAEGYARKGDAAVIETIPLCVALRAVASCGWAATRTRPGDPRRRAYADRALDAAERVCSPRP